MQGPNAASTMKGVGSLPSAASMARWRYLKGVTGVRWLESAMVSGAMSWMSHCPAHVGPTSTTARELQPLMLYVQGCRIQECFSNAWLRRQTQTSVELCSLALNRTDCASPTRRCATQTSPSALSVQTSITTPIMIMIVIIIGVVMLA